MDLTSMLAQLRTEREQIEEAILALERLAGKTTKRRGRPPKWLSKLKPGSQPLAKSGQNAEAPERKSTGRRPQATAT
jgi:hypothetical protein